MSKLISSEGLIKKLVDKWNKEHPEYDDTSGSMSYNEIINFIREYAESEKD